MFPQSLRVKARAIGPVPQGSEVDTPKTRGARSTPGFRAGDCEEFEISPVAAFRGWPPFERKRQGLGSRLMRPQLDAADRDGTTVCLDALIARRSRGSLAAF